MNRTFRRGLTVVALAGALSAARSTMARAGTAGSRGRNAVGDLGRSAEWLSFAVGNSIAAAGSGAVARVQENINGNLPRARIHNVKTQQLRNGTQSSSSTTPPPR